MSALTQARNTPRRLGEVFDFPVKANTTVQVCGMGAPSSGALAMGQIMGTLAQTKAANDSAKPWGERNTVVPSANWLHHYNEAARLAFADRALYVADPAFVKAPGPGREGLL